MVRTLPTLSIDMNDSTRTSLACGEDTNPIFENCFSVSGPPFGNAAKVDATRSHIDEDGFQCPGLPRPGWISADSHSALKASRKGYKIPRPSTAAVRDPPKSESPYLNVYLTSVHRTRLQARQNAVPVPYVDPSLTARPRVYFSSSHRAHTPEESACTYTLDASGRS